MARTMAKDRQELFRVVETRHFPSDPDLDFTEYRGPFTLRRIAEREAAQVARDAAGIMRRFPGRAEITVTVETTGPIEWREVKPEAPAKPLPQRTES